jgi:hypothetical protein
VLDLQAHTAGGLANVLRGLGLVHAEAGLVLRDEDRAHEPHSVSDRLRITRFPRSKDQLVEVPPALGGPSEFECEVAGPVDAADARQPADLDQLWVSTQNQRRCAASSVRERTPTFA